MAPSSSDNARLERSSSIDPAEVSSTLRVVRTNNTTPKSRSSSRIARDRGDCDMCNRVAARPKWSSSATATKYRSCRSSMGASMPADTDPHRLPKPGAIALVVEQHALPRLPAGTWGRNPQHDP